MTKSEMIQNSIDRHTQLLSDYKEQEPVLRLKLESIARRHEDEMADAARALECCIDNIASCEAVIEALRGSALPGEIAPAEPGDEPHLSVPDLENKAVHIVPESAVKGFVAGGPEFGLHESVLRAIVREWAIGMGIMQ